MSEKRFTYDKPLVAFSKGGINDNVTGETYEFTMDTVLDLLNDQDDELHKYRTENAELHITILENEKEIDEQQATIRKLQDLCGKSDGENAKLRIENKRLQEEKGYWESKAMTLLLQVRRLTSRMTDKEVEEFKKELEDD